MSVVVVPLVLSATAKIASPAEARNALRTLGLRAPLATVAVRAGSACELLVAGAATAAPASPLAAVALLTLFGGFAAAGVAAILKNQRINCGCFGSIGGTRLGTGQLYQLAFVAAIVLWLRHVRTSWGLLPAFSVFIAALTFSAIVFLAIAARASRQIRQDRVSLAAARAYISTQRHPIHEEATR